MKKLKDTKIGAFLKDKAPDVLSLVGDLLPDAGGLGIVKNLIENKFPNADKRNELLAELNDLELEYLKDVQDAREMYEKTDHKTADEIADNIIRYNLIMIMAMVLIQVGVIMYVEGQIAAVITGVVGTVTGALLNERQQVVGFFFGSSAGSKDKDKK